MRELVPRMFFQNNSQVEFDKIINCFEAPIKHIRTGETIYTFGKCSDIIGIIEDGQAVMSRTDINGSVTILERLSGGGIFGEIIAFSLLLNDNVTVVAESDCTVLFLSYRKIMQPCAKDCDCHRVLVDNMFRLISRKAVELSERVEILSCRTIKEKLIFYFRIASSKEQSLCFQIPFSLSTLADYICSDRSAMMRELKKLRDKGLVKISRRNVCVDKRVFDRI